MTTDILDYHATPVEAAETAQAAGVSFLLLSHVVPPLPIGMMRFQLDGPASFVATLNQIMRTPNSLSWWYLKAIGILAEHD